MTISNDNSISAKHKRITAKRNERRGFYFLRQKPVNYQRVIHYFELAHQYYVQTNSLVGNASATYNLGILYKTAPPRYRNYYKAYQLISQAAKAEHHKAYRVLAKMYEEGKGTKKNHALSLQWLNCAAEYGDSAAKLQLAQIHKDQYDHKQAREVLNELIETQYKAIAYRLLGEMDETIDQNESAEKHFQLAHNLGDNEATFHLGRIASQNTNDTLAKNFLQQSTDLNHSKSCDHLAQLYEKEKNYLKALSLYKRNAYQGYAESQFHLHKLYSTNNDFYRWWQRGSNKTRQLSFYWCLRAASSGYKPAFFPLSQFYWSVNGIVNGIYTGKKDVHKYIKWALKSALAHDCQAIAQLQNPLVQQQHEIHAALQSWVEESYKGNAKKSYWIGAMYQHGFLLEQNHIEAETYYERAAYENQTEAINALGYYRQRDPNDDKSNSRQDLRYDKLLKKAFKLNNFSALNRLAYKYQHGFTENRIKDIRKAKSYYQMAIRLGDYNAMYYLSRGIVENIYPNMNKKLVVHLYKRAAKQNISEAMYELAHCYEKGINFCPVDKKIALSWYQLVAKTEIREVVKDIDLECYNTLDTKIRCLKIHIKFNRMANKKDYGLEKAIGSKSNAISVALPVSLKRFQYVKQQEIFLYQSLQALSSAYKTAKNISLTLYEYANKDIAFLINEAEKINQEHPKKYTPYHNGRRTPPLNNIPKDQQTGKYEPFSIALYQAAAIHLNLTALYALKDIYADPDSDTPTEEQLTMLMFQSLRAKAYPIIYWISHTYYVNNLESIKQNKVLSKELSLLLSNKEPSDFLNQKAKLNHDIIDFDLKNNNPVDNKQYEQWMTECKKLNSIESLNILNKLVIKPLFNSDFKYTCLRDDLLELGNKTQIKETPYNRYLFNKALNFYHNVIVTAAKTTTKLTIRTKLNEFALFHEYKNAAIQKATPLKDTHLPDVGLDVGFI
jgi:TPR repeat protein